MYFGTEFTPSSFSASPFGTFGSSILSKTPTFTPLVFGSDWNKQFSAVPLQGGYNFNGYNLQQNSSMGQLQTMQNKMQKQYEFRLGCLDKDQEALAKALEAIDDGQKIPYTKDDLNLRLKNVLAEKEQIAEMLSMFS
jgi:hypothetical protein